MPNTILNQETVNPASTQEVTIQQLVSDEIEKTLSVSRKNTTIIATTCILISIAVVVFSIFYIAELKRHILLSFEEVVQDVHSDFISSTDPSSSPAISKDQTIIVQLESANLLSADYLAVVLPVLISLAGAFIVFLGMNRLKMYDERIDSTRSDLLKELNTMVSNHVLATYTKQSEKTQKFIRSEKNSFKKVSTDTTNYITEEGQRIINEIKSVGTKYEWLKGFEALVTDGIDVMNIYTVFDAHQVVETLLQKKPDDYYYVITTIISHVINDSVPGDSTDFHNLAAELARNSRYDDACKILHKGLETFPRDTDLLASLVLYAIRGGMTPEANDAVHKLKSIDYRFWGYRCYLHLNEFYRSVGNLEAADAVCDEYIKALPTDERGYCQKAKIARILTPGIEGIQKSIALLNQALSKSINCAQCANLLGETYLELGNYIQALDAFTRTVQELAQEHPYVNSSLVFYNRALCYDRMFMESIRNNNQDLTHALNAYTDYVTAIDQNGLHSLTKAQAVRRTEILKRYLPDTPSDLK